jgi:hypothetical protein
MTDADRTDVPTRSFVGARYADADLRGADFQGADVRQASFHGADLRGANFSNARAGPTAAWSIVLLLTTLGLSLALGVAAGFGGLRLQRFAASGDPREQVVAAAVLVGLVVFVVIAVWRGMEHAMRLVMPGAAGVAVLVAVAAVASGLGPGRGALGALVLLILLATIIGLGALARAIAGAVAQWAFVLVAVAGGLIGGWVGGGATAAIVAVAAMLVGRRSMHERPGSAHLTHAALRIACAHGTRFDGADLRGAIFDGARLDRSDFSGARLEGVRLDAAHIRSCLFDEGTKVTPVQSRR